MADEKTYYSPKDLKRVMRLVKEIKNITVKAQDFVVAAHMRDAERLLMDKLDVDKNRKI